MTVNSERVTITSLAYGGDAVGVLDKKVIFIPDAVPGDVVNVRVTEDKGSFLRGEIEKIVSPSPNRVEPFCPLSSRCGGCQWQAVAYPEQLQWKQTIVKESLRRISNISDVLVEPCLPSPLERGYRTVARYPAKVTGKGVVFGYYERRSHRITDVENCPVASDRINDIAKYIKKLLSTDNSDMDIREITIQASFNRPSALVSITTGGSFKMKTLANQILTNFPWLDGVSHLNANSMKEKIYGKNFRQEDIEGKSFRITGSSFFQVNTAQTEQLVRIVSNMLELQVSDVVVDGYGGVGTFSLSTVPIDREIHLYDSSPSAVSDSIFNADKMGFKKFSAYTEKTASASEIIGHADVLILDPPRQGLGRETVKAASSFGARTIIYISCNPATLARDLKLFIDDSYAIELVAPVDMFPHTYHIETVVKLTKNI